MQPDRARSSRARWNTSCWLSCMIWLGAALGCGTTPERTGTPPRPAAARQQATQAAERSAARRATQQSAAAAEPADSVEAEASAEREPAALAARADDVQAQPDPKVDETAAVLALEGSHSSSAGAPGAGTLQGGVALPSSGPGFIHNPKRPPDARYGTVELVQAIVRAAATVARELPGIPLVVNDLSLPEGGPIPQHGSHQSGRDADILFYVLDEHRQPLRSVGVPLDPDGKGWDFKSLPVLEDDVRVQLDAERTWRFMHALIEAGGDHLQRIFIVEHVRAMLLEQAERVGAPEHVRERFAAVTCQPGTPHDDHMHVRFYCSPEDIGAGCLDKPPLYPWHEETLAALGLEPVLERAWNRPKRTAQVASRTTTREQARKRAGPMHPKVRRFLAEREHWAEKPRPGRRWCK